MEKRINNELHQLIDRKTEKQLTKDTVCAYKGMCTYHIESLIQLVKHTLACRLVQSIQLGFIFLWKQLTTILSNTYLTEFSKNLKV